jgi:hypothetical protein
MTNTMEIVNEIMGEITSLETKKQQLIDGLNNFWAQYKNVVVSTTETPTEQAIGGEPIDDGGNGLPEKEVNELDGRRLRSSKTREKIMKAITKGGSSVKQIRTALGIWGIRKHLKAMVKDGSLEVSRDGNRQLFFNPVNKTSKEGKQHHPLQDKRNVETPSLEKIAKKNGGKVDPQKAMVNAWKNGGSKKK